MKLDLKHAKVLEKFDEDEYIPGYVVEVPESNVYSKSKGGTGFLFMNTRKEAKETGWKYFPVEIIEVVLCFDEVLGRFKSTYDVGRFYGYAHRDMQSESKVVDEDTKIILNGKKYLLEKGDRIRIKK